MPGAPATSPRLGIPRFSNADAADFAGDVNSVVDRVDQVAGMFLSGTLGVRPPAGIVDRFYYATDDTRGGQNGTLYRDTGAAWVPILSFIDLLDAYGNGGDGVMNFAGNWILLRDYFASQITVPVGGTVVTAAWRLFSTGPVTISGTVKNDGWDAQGILSGAGGYGSAVGYFAGGGAGGGGASINGGGSAAERGRQGGAGGAGGDARNDLGNVTSAGGPGAGAAGGAAVVTSQLGKLGGLLGSSPLWGGGSGGGQGGAGGTANSNGGGGGGGGGVVMICAPSITIAPGGLVSAKGGKGANGFTDAANQRYGGGGGGGGGGLVLFVCHEFVNNGTVDVSGGPSGASGGGNSAPGAAGAAGSVVTYTLPV